MATGTDSSFTEKRLRMYDDDDIVRYSLGQDVPIVGLLRNRDEYKEMREIALIYGTTLGLRQKQAAPQPEATTADAAGELTPDETANVPVRKVGASAAAPKAPPQE